MISIYELLQIKEIDPKQCKFIRHGNKEVNAYETFKTDIRKFELYTAWQRPNKFGKAKYLVIFSPYKSTTARLLGIWEVKSVIKNEHLRAKDLQLLKKYNLPLHWYDKSDFYQINRLSLLDDLSERLIIEWGMSTVTWVQNKNKEIVELKPKNSLDEFTSYDSVELNFSELEMIAKNKESNPTWINALSSVNGIYLIRDKSSNKLYVGSAYGKNGIFGRWTSYARTGHGGNKLLKPLKAQNFVFTILEIFPFTLSSKEVIARERLWIKRLATKENGLNDK